MTNEKSKRLENIDTLPHTEVEHKEHSTDWIKQDFSHLFGKQVGGGED